MRRWIDVPKLELAAQDEAERGDAPRARDDAEIARLVRRLLLDDRPHGDGCRAEVASEFAAARPPGRQRPRSR